MSVQEQAPPASAGSRRGTARRLVAVTAEGVASGTPLMVGSKLLQGWLTATGVPISMIGLLSLAELPYTLKLFWAPLLDRWPIPWPDRRRGWFVKPTLIETTDVNCRLLKEEIFGPVAVVVTVDSDEEAIRLANDTDYGLISYVYSGALDRAIRVSEAMESGMVAINRGVISDPAAPFGGYKESGLGREGGFDGIHEFLQTKYIGVEI